MQKIGVSLRRLLRSAVRAASSRRAATDTGTPNRLSMERTPASLVSAPRHDEPVTAHDFLGFTVGSVRHDARLGNNGALDPETAAHLHLALVDVAQPNVNLSMAVQTYFAAVPVSAAATLPRS